MDDTTNTNITDKPLHRLVLYFGDHRYKLWRACPNLIAMVDVQLNFPATSTTVLPGFQLHGINTDGHWTSLSIVIPTIIIGERKLPIFLGRLLTSTIDVGIRQTFEVTRKTVQPSTVIERTLDYLGIARESFNRGLYFEE